MINILMTILALSATAICIGLLYYRAELKRSLELLNDPKRDLKRNIPGIGTSLSYFFEEPEVSQALRESKLFGKYDKMGTMIKYSFLIAIIFHVARVYILSLI